MVVGIRDTNHETALKLNSTNVIVYTLSLCIVIHESNNACLTSVDHMMTYSIWLHIVADPKFFASGAEKWTSQNDKKKKNPALNRNQK